MPQRTYKAVFFDLDGTLLPIDMDGFLERYFGSIAAFAQSKGFDPQRFSNALNKGVRGMCTTEGGLNADRFWGIFLELMGETDRPRFETIMQEFYEEHFDELADLVVNPDPAAARAVKALKAKGYPMYLTTMPLFPRIAVEKRVQWAGVPVESFSRITTYDNSTSTKPRLDYYRENVEHIGLAPEDILMVGNNTREDLAAMELGCDGYLVTNWLIDPDGYDIESVKHGTLAEFAEFAEQLPECE